MSATTVLKRILALGLTTGLVLVIDRKQKFLSFGEHVYEESHWKSS